MVIFLEEGIFEGGLEGWSWSLLSGEGREGGQSRQSKLPANDKKIPFPQDISLPSARIYWYESVMSTMRMWHPCGVLNLHNCTWQIWSTVGKGTEVERACGGLK